MYIYLSIYLAIFGVDNILAVYIAIYSVHYYSVLMTTFLIH